MTEDAATDDAANQAQPDPREEKFVVETELLTQDQLNGLVEEYCTRYHGLNETESPLAERDKVAAAVKRGDLVVWFDPVENTAGLGAPA
ncbi:YheU family protein [Marinobacter alexandrii]|uniref:YheU family protein n=1 Tax=Marinobacter alexandrii TaxID=2570351 RepID=UPI0011092FAC|nr:YheU family protein [Marinobacter alexandrii]